MSTVSFSKTWRLGSGRLSASAPAVVATLTVLAAWCASGRALGSGEVRASDQHPTTSPPNDGDETYRKLAIFAQVLHYIENNYVDETRADRLVYGAIKGMISTLDGHSVFMEPDQFAALRRHASDEASEDFGGIGIEIEKRPGGFFVVEAHEDAPGARAGLRLGDELLAIDSEATHGMTLGEVTERVRGRIGSAVALRIRRNRGGNIEELEIARARVRFEPVRWRWIGAGLGYVRIKGFTQRTSQGVERALASLHSEGPIRGLIMDLRDNSGGLLEEAVRVADAWLSRGIIVSTEGRNRETERQFAHPKGTEPDYPLVCLVNGGTASASEILAGSLQDHARAVLVGTQTFGKGSVQTVIELDDGSALRLTIARYFTPSRRSIQGTGIAPDVVIPARSSLSDDPEERRDPQLVEATRVLTSWVDTQVRPNGGLGRSRGGPGRSR